MLSNLESDSAKLLQIVLVGQPELRSTLERTDMRQLRQRISITCHLARLSRPEVEEYILHRLEVAGNREALSFSSGAFDRIYDCSGGIPRLVNVICSFLLITTFAEKTGTVNAVMVDDTVEGIGLASHSDNAGDPASGDNGLLRTAAGATARREQGGEA